MDISGFLRPESGELPLHLMLLRGILVFILSFLFFRLAGFRTLGKLSLTDHITLLIIGSIMGRSVVTTQPFIPSMMAVFLIICLHRASTWLAFHNKKIGQLIKGRAVLLVKEGKLQNENMRKLDISEHDIMVALRLRACINNLNRVSEAYLERNGDISIVLKDD